MPPDHLLAFTKNVDGERLIVPAREVRRRTGTYMLRDYSRGGPYATVATPDDVRRLYCSVNATTIIPNFNKNNIFNENRRHRA